MTQYLYWIIILNENKAVNVHFEKTITKDLSQLLGINTFEIQT